MGTRLGAARDDEQMRVEVVLARAHAASSELGSSDSLGQRRGLRAVGKQLDLWQREGIGRAREQGASWAEIGDALGVGKQAAWKLYNEGVRAMLAEVRQRS